MTRRAAMLVRGTTVLPLDIVGSGSVRTVITDRGSKFKVVPQQYDLTGQGGSGELYEESWTVMLRECSQKLAPVPILERIERRMRSPGHEVEPAVAQLLVEIGRAHV